MLYQNYDRNLCFGLLLSFLLFVSDVFRFYGKLLKSVRILPPALISPCAFAIIRLGGDSMISEYESYAVEAMLGFYNNDFDQFLEFLDENVIWYGPKQGQYVVGKENLKNTVCVRKDDRAYRVENVQTKLISYMANLYSIVVTYQLHSCRPDGTVKTVFQHVVANGQKIRDRGGNIFWRCPFIHVSNAELKDDSGADGFSSYCVAPKKLLLGGDAPRLVLPGDNHTTVISAGTASNMLSVERV